MAGHWERCAPWLQAALDRAGNTHSLDDVRAAIEAGAAHFFPGHRSAMVVEVLTYPRKRALNVWLAGGDLRELMIHVPMLRRLAADWGCGRLQVTGRPGWTRVLGARPVSVTMVEDL